MEHIFYSIIKADCQEISSSLNDNGLLEFTIPNNCTNEDLSKYFNNLGKEELSRIASKQKKATKVFRKKVTKMIDEYKKDFNLDLSINLRLANKTKKLIDWNVQTHGIASDGNLSIASILQYFPDESLGKIIRGAVYMTAWEYENICSQRKNITVGVFEFPDGEVEHSTYKVPENEKYHISVPYSETQKIKEDYETAYNQILEDLDKCPINYI